MEKIDVAINVYGKPYQTAVTLKSLMKYSGDKINKIYLSFEKEQPYGHTIEDFLPLLVDLPIEYYFPKYFFWTRDKFEGLKNKLKLLFPSYRKSIRYQYAWEATKSPYLLVIHNDVLFQADLVSYYLENIGEFIGIGRVGQCWNCPGSINGCSSEKYWDYRPKMEELRRIYTDFPVQRAKEHGFLNDGKVSWPLPECRLNELVTLLNMKIAKPLILPFGSVAPFGIGNSIDNGIEWFRGISKIGHKVKHLDFEPFAIHAWANESKFGGHPSLFDEKLYQHEENIAKKKLETSDY